MRPLIGIILYLLSFCGRLGAAPIEVTSEPNNTFMKKIIETNWNQLNTQFIPNGIFNTPELIKKAGYPMEAHVIITKDSYILTLHRIPGGNSSLPVLLQHGFLSTSVDWVILGKGKALAFLLADQGYDVWLGNFRGNTYSKAHIFLSPSDTKFWDFSYNEMGIYDIPAMITFITNMRSQPLHTYIGYSMGAGSFYIMASEHPEIAQMVEMMISLAPGVFLNHMQSFIQYLVPFKDEVKTMIQLFFHGELHQDFINFFIKYVCDQNSMREICFDVMSMIWGYDREQFNNTLLPIILSNDPASTSIKTLTHFGQVIESGKFRKYDYGREKNLLIYNSAEPPDYNLANVAVPTALFYSDNDWLISIEDIQRLYRALPNVMDMYEIPWPKFNHVDFIWAKDAPKLVYERVLKLMKGQNFNSTLVR